MSSLRPFFLSSAASLLVLAAGSTACLDRTCTSLSIKRSVDGTMAIGDSERLTERLHADALRHANIVEDAGSDPAAPAEAVAEKPARAVKHWPAHSHGFDLRGDLCATDATCANLYLGDSTYRLRGVYMRWLLPTGVGDFALSELQAELCEDRADELHSAMWTCVPLDGTLKVHAFHAPCSDSKCGRLDANLVLANLPSPPPSTAYATGSVHLSYEAKTEDYACADSFGSFPAAGQ